MRKFPKLLAVVLAVAIVICPAMCLTSMAAEPNGTYAFDANVVASGAYDTATLHIDSETGYLVAVAKAELTGYALSSDENAVTAVDNNAENLSVESKVSGTILTMLVKRVDVTDLSPITAATISIKVVKDDSTQHYITLTHIQAADQGTVGDDGTLGDENLLTFPCANNNENGLINQVEAAEKGLNVVAGTNCSHDNATTTTVVEPTCTGPGEEKHTCPDCGAEWTTPIDALGHDGVVTSISDTQHAEVCSRCGVTIDGTTADHTFDEKNTCTGCGYKKTETGPKTVETTFKHNMTLANSTRINIYIDKNDQWNSCATIEAVVTREDYQTGENKPKTSVITFTSYNSKLYRAEYGNFLSYQYGDVFTAHILGKDANGNIIYESAKDDVYCVKAYCATQLQSSAAKDATKIVCADLLKFGARAQDFFGNYRTASGDYADKDDSRYTVEQYIDTYATKTTPVLTKTTVDDGSGVKVLSSLTCGSSIDFNMICKKSEVTGYDINNLRYVMTYTNYKGNKMTVEITGDKFDGDKAKSYWYATCSELFVADFSSDLTINLYNGEELISNTRHSSVEAYAKQMIEKTGASEAQINFYNAMMNYSRSAANI